MNTTTLTWLKAWSLANAGAGLLIALSAFTPLDWPARVVIDVAFWPLDGNPGLQSAEAGLLAAIGGGAVAGWCLLLCLLIGRAARSEDRVLLRLAVVSLLTWFAIDSIGSIAAGAWMNAVLNVVILAGFLVPLMLDRAVAGVERTESQGV